jgi:PDZ domain-containing protein
MKGTLLLSLAAAALGAATLHAQAKMARPDSTCTKYSDGRMECRAIRTRSLGDPGFGNVFFMRMDSAMSKRAALGVELRTTGTRRDTLGVFVEGVTPKGPAENAGIIEGDRIAAINGVDLRTASSDVEDSYMNGLAAHRLTREVEKLTPGSRVTLRVYSGGRFRDVQVVAGKASDVMQLGDHLKMRVPGPEGMQLDGPGMQWAPLLEMTPGRAAPFPRAGDQGLLRERIESAPNAIRLRTQRIRTLTPLLRTYRAGNAGTARLWADAIKEIFATTIQDARDALKQLSAAEAA